LARFACLSRLSSEKIFQERGGLAMGQTQCEMALVNPWDEELPHGG